MDLVLSRSFRTYCILFWGPSTVSMAYLAVMKTLGIGPFSQFFELLHTVLGSVDSFEGISGIPENSRIWSFLAVLWDIAYCSVVRRQFRGHFWHSWKLVDFILSRSFRTYCILFWGPSIVSRVFLAFLKTRGFGPFSQFYELLHTVLGSIESFECISGIHENSWIWSFVAVLGAITYCFGIRR